MRAAALLLAMLPLAAASSAPVPPAAEPIDLQLKRARGEASAADARARKLEEAADAARGEVAKVHARQLAVAEAIEASEARITAADAELRLLSATLAERRRRLEREQRPTASLLAGLVMMAQRPPLLAIADGGSTDEFVEVRLLLDSTLPVIRRRTFALTAELQEGRRLAASAQETRQRLARSRDELARRRSEFAALETRALAIAEGRGSAALAAGDIALSTGEGLEQLTAQAEDRRAARSIAADLAAAPAAPPRPVRGSAAPTPPIDYRLPADAVVVEGLGSVSPNGVRSRGITLQTRHGTALFVPASGTIRFAGPYRAHDGIVIIDHGEGWMSLLVGVASSLKVGERVRLGEPLGRALGPLLVELSHNGQRISPALIAGSSQSLSKGRKDG